MTSAIVVHGPCPIEGTPRLVGDKSISHRALLLASLATGTTTIANLSPCADVERTRSCLQQLGVAMDEAGPNTVAVAGRGLHGLAGPPVELDCGDSATTMRLLAGMLAGQDRRFTLTGTAALSRRPMRRVVDPLRSMGARLTATEGHAPIEGEGAELHGADIALDIASAQIGSAILLAGLAAPGVTTVRYPGLVRDHTERMLRLFGAAIEWDGEVSRLAAGGPALAPPGEGIAVPDDFSAAACFLVGAAIVAGSRVRLRRVGMNAGRTGLLHVLSQMGSAHTSANWNTHAYEWTADIDLDACPLHACDVKGPLVPRLIDELPLVAVLGAHAAGRTTVRDASELRHKESDRVAGIVQGLARMGADIAAEPDGFSVNGGAQLHGAQVDGQGDHRLVMALVVAGLAARGDTAVAGADCVADSYPGFVDHLRALGAHVEAAG